MKKLKFIKIILTFMLTILITGLCSCGQTPEYSSEFFAMDTVMTVTVYGGNSKDAERAAEAEINRLSAHWSAEDPKSETSVLNRDKCSDVSPDTAELISRACKLSLLTDGDFDITVYPLVSAWGFYSNKENRVPKDDEINTLLKSIGYKNIHINGTNIKLSGVSIDLGGIAKGYASAAAADILKDKGIVSAVMSLGGNVRVIGNRPDGSQWNVAIADPFQSSSNIGVISVTDCAVITSGGYQRYFEKNGKKYHHIIDPKTGRPAESGLASVTVVSSDDVVADALSTALFVKGLDESIEFYRENPGLFEAIFVTDGNDIYVTSTLSQDFSCRREFEVILP